VTASLHTSKPLFSNERERNIIKIDPFLSMPFYFAHLLCVCAIAMSETKRGKSERERNEGMIRVALSASI
jgi:hypothetical protein